MRNYAPAPHLLLHYQRRGQQNPQCLRPILAMLPCRQWLAASKEEASKLPRAALSCRLCKGVLMLGPASLRQHLDSKKHLARLKRKAEGFEPVFLAMGAQVFTKLPWSLSPTQSIGLRSL